MQTKAKPVTEKSGNPIVLFDGVCNLCHHSVQFLLKRNSEKTLRFASLQSELGQTLLEQFNLPSDLDTVVLIENGAAYIRSTAALRALRHTSNAWPFLYLCIIIPAPIRDLAYRMVATVRYRFFGKKESCPLPDPSLADRFLD